MYHSISEAVESKSHPYYWTATAPDIFTGHMRFLYEHGYTSISLGEAVRRIDVQGAPEGNGEKAVVITFDDGYADFYTHAFPELSRYGFTATMFLPTAYIGDSPRGFKGANCLTWREIRELRQANIDFGSHTVTHPELKTLVDKDIRREVRASKAMIEDKLGCAVTSFAYPYAFPEADNAFAGRLTSILKEAGYTNGVSTIIGTASGSDNRFFMRRLPVNSGDDVRFLQAKLEGAYDWLHSLQYAGKLTQVRSAAM